VGLCIGWYRSYRLYHVIAIFDEDYKPTITGGYNPIAMGVELCHVWMPSISCHCTQSVLVGTHLADIMRHTLMISKIFLQGNDDGIIFDPNFHLCWSLKSSSCVRVCIFWPALKSHGCVFRPQKSRPTSRMILHDCFPAWDICRKTSETPIITGKNHGFCLTFSYTNPAKSNDS